MDDYRGIGRGVWESFEAIRHADCGPFWASSASPPSLARVKQEGVNCVGLVALVLREAGILLPYTQRDLAWPVDSAGNALGGTGSTDEWLWLLKDDARLLRFDPQACYPRGSFLFRCSNSVDQGHVSILLEDTAPVTSARVYHTAGGPVGRGLVTCYERVEDQENYYVHHPLSRTPETQPWDTTGEFTVAFDGPYYTHVFIHGWGLHLPEPEERIQPCVCHLGDD